MPGLRELLLASVLTAGGHEMGHQVEADRLNQPIVWNGSQWASSANGDNLAKISGAGFRMQDALSRASGNPTQSAVNALHKVSYLTRDRGDLATLQKSKGKKAADMAKGALAVSAISDLLRSFGKVRNNRGFKFGQSDTGTPMLVYGGNF
jgi:hypothetical protein